MSDRPCALVTGAGRGIGRAIAMALAREGYDLAGNDIGYDADEPTRDLAETRVLCEEAGAGFLPLPADIAETVGKPTKIDYPGAVAPRDK